MSIADILRTRGKGVSSDADVRIFWRKKHRIFEIYGVSARTRGVEPVWTSGAAPRPPLFTKVIFVNRLKLMRKYLGYGSDVTTMLEFQLEFVTSGFQRLDLTYILCNC